jgi:hypothetical protein
MSWTLTTSWAPPQLLLIARGEGKMHSCFSVYPTFWSCSSVDTCSEEVSDLCSEDPLPSSTYAGKTRYPVNLQFSPFLCPDRVTIPFLLQTRQNSAFPTFNAICEWPDTFKLHRNHRSLRVFIEDPVEKKYCPTSIEYTPIYPSLNFGKVYYSVDLFKRGKSVMYI